MMKTLSFRRSFLLLAVVVLCIAVCKKEPDLPDDPHITQVGNPFIGVWSVGGEFWQFRRDGTGGRAVTEAGPFSDDFSFFIYAGQDVQTVPSDGQLVMFDYDNVTLYDFSIKKNKATLTHESGSNVVLERVSGSPQVIKLTNSLIGEWSADWTSEHGSTWSIKYREDGTVKTYHHQVKHQFENAYALRGDTLVIFGAWRFGIAPVIAALTSLENGTLQITEKQSSPAPAQWIYTKVAAAEWL